MEPRVGVLALQGACEAHLAAFARLNVPARATRRPEELHDLTHLVLPGGESTTQHHLLERFGLWNRIRTRYRAGELVLFGTCAGAILLSTGDGRPPTLELLDARIQRNAFGSQSDSFAASIEFEDGPFPGVFIRAPRFTGVGPLVRVLGRLCAEPVLVEGQGLLAATFHPELTDDPRVHARFLALRPDLNADASLAGAPDPSAGAGRRA